MKKFVLPISPEYVAHWGLWEAVREIWQNAIDAETVDPNCEATMTYANSQIKIATSKGHLSRETLVLGNTSKRDDPNQRGKFGEGYKLALLVLARIGHDVRIFNGTEQWIPMLEHDDNFNSTVLSIYVEPHDTGTDYRDGVEFVISGVTPDMHAAIQRNIKITPVDGYKIYENESEKGRIYVGGLYVSTMKEFHCGYSFMPGLIKLDRDRGMVDGFDLSYETSKLWTQRGGDRAVALMESEAPDVRYVESHAHRTSPLTMHSLSHFIGRHGHDAIPVSNQEEIELATKAGMKWVLVPDAVKNILRTVKSWFIPSGKTILERLREFSDKYSFMLTGEAKNDLNEIIEEAAKGNS